MQVGTLPVPTCPRKDLVLMSQRHVILVVSVVDIILTSADLFLEVFAVYRQKPGPRVMAQIIGVLLTGPICGHIGARTLNHMLVGVYVFFSLLQLLFGLAIYFDQFTGLVFRLLMRGTLTLWAWTFFIGLGSVASERRQQLLVEQPKELIKGIVCWSWVLVPVYIAAACFESLLQIL